LKSNLKALPYPVLGRSDDFTDSAFQTTIDFEKKPKGETENIAMSYSFLLSSNEITKLVASKKASFALDVSCTDTLYRRVIFCDGNSGSVEFEPGDLYGRVTIEPMVVIRALVDSFEADDLNSEYQGVKFRLAPGDTIAIDETITRFIEFDKLRFESLVRIQTSEDIPTDTYRFDQESDFITILMGRNFRSVWDIYRDERDKAPFLALSVFKDCILSALYSLSHSEGEEQYKWARALVIKLSSMGIKIYKDADLNELNTIAQQLVSKLSVKRLLKNA
jgi:hypothetical protein